MATKRYICSLCSKKFSSKKGQKDHRKAVHPPLKLTTNATGVSFGASFSLVEEHKGQIHKTIRFPVEKKPTPCQDPCIDPLDRWGKPERVYECGFCRKTFSSKKGQKDHRRAVHVMKKATPRDEQERIAIEERIEQLERRLLARRAVLLERARIALEAEERERRQRHPTQEHLERRLEARMERARIAEAEERRRLNRINDG
jgi:DNA-directed RNA polymerase subunit RPC12/RpoP